MAKFYAVQAHFSDLNLTQVPTLPWEKCGKTIELSDLPECYLASRLTIWSPENTLWSDMPDAPTTEKLSRKERARLQRRAAYLRAKEQRDHDPRYLAMKEAAKKHRRKVYQAVKERRKAATAEQKRKRKLTDEGERVAKRADAGVKLLKMVKPATKPE